MSPKHIFKTIHLRFLYLAGWKPYNMALFYARMLGKWKSGSSVWWVV